MSKNHIASYGFKQMLDDENQNFFFKNDYFLFEASPSTFQPILNAGCHFHIMNMLINQWYDHQSNFHMKKLQQGVMMISGWVLSLLQPIKQRELLLPILEGSSCFVNAIIIPYYRALNWFLLSEKLWSSGI